MLKAVLQSKIKPNLSVSCARGHWSVAIALFVAALAALLDPAAAHAQSGSSYTWTNFVGTPGVPGGSDGTGSSALFSSPAGITVDGSGNLYVASSSDTVRRVTPAGVVTTIAGIFNVPGNTNGTGSNARFNQPFGIALDGSGNAYVVDSGNNEIRYMTQAGVVSTLAGGFSSPNGAASDSAGNLYVADSNNSTIRKVTPAGVVTTVAGVAGITGTADGMGSAARFYHPYGIAVDGSNNLFVADTANKTIREITPAGLVSTIAGTPLVAGSNDGLAATAHFSDPYGIAVDSNGDIFVADTLNFTVREISSLGNVTTIGGLPGVSGTQGGIGSAARFLQVMGLVVGPGGALYVCDNANARISVGVPSNFATGSVAVNIVPSGAVTAGAQWQLDGGSLQPSGATISTGTGSHTITYSAAAGYTAPASQPVAVSAGQTTAVTGTYNAILPATLTVNIAPQSAIDAGATWRVDGGIAIASGVTVTLPVGPHTVSFFATGGWNPPADQIVALASGQATLVTGTYTSSGVVQTGTGAYIWSSFVGNPATPGGADGTGAAAQFVNPGGVAIDGSGNLYIASNSDTIRTVTPAGVVKTIAGVTNSLGNTDGVGSNARFNQPYGIAIDGSGNAYVVDSANEEVRYVTSAGVVTTLNLAASFNSPNGCAVDPAGNLYVADAGNDAVRKITPARVVTTFAGQLGISGTANGAGTAAQFFHDYAVASDAAGNIYVADTAGRTIREITPAGVVTTIAGTANVSGSADGVGASALFLNPEGICVDSATNIYVTDNGFNTIRKITPSGVVTTIGGFPGITGTEVGIGTAAHFNFPLGIAVTPDGTLYVGDQHNNRIMKGVLLSSTSGSVTVSITPAGAVTAGAQWQLDGGASHASGATVSTGTGAHTITFSPLSGWTAPASQGIAIAAGQTVALTGTYSLIPTGFLTVNILPQAAIDAGATWQVDGGAPLSSGTTVVLPTGSHQISFLPAIGWTPPAGQPVLVATGQTTILDDTYTEAAGVVGSGTYAWSNFVGDPGVVGSVDGAGASATFDRPNGLTLDGSGNLYVVSNSDTLRTVTPAGVVTTIAGADNAGGTADGPGASARFNQPWGVALDGTSGLYVVDSANSTIRFVTPQDIVSTLAGTPFNYGGADGTGSAAQFHYPNGCASDSAGNLYVADSNNSTIRKVTPAGVVTTIAGQVQVTGSADGIGTAATFNHPYSLAVDPVGNIFVADYTNSTIRKITPAHVVTTIAGSPGVTGSADGIGSAARFFYPLGIAVDANDDVFVGDSSNDTIRKITPAGLVTTIGGLPGVTGTQGGVGSNARFSNPLSIVVSPTGVLYVVDELNSRIAAGIPQTGGTGRSTFSSNGDVVFIKGTGSIVINVLANDTPAAGGVLSIVSVTQGLTGTVTINPDGTLTYTPFKTFEGIDSFTYTVTDGVGDTATQTVIVGNGSLAGAGVYSGLITNATPTNADSGAITLTLTTSGHFTGKLSLAGLRYSISGAFDANWNAMLTISRPNLPALTVDMELNPGMHQITGTVSDGTFNSSINAGWLNFDPRLAPAPQAGIYTMILPPDPATTGSAAFPQGIGFCVMQIHPGGGVVVIGKLGDGTSLSTSGLIVSGSNLPLYQGLYGKSYPTAGSIFGNIVFSGSTCGGTLYWFKPAQTSGARFRQGFSTTSQAIGSLFVPPSSSASAGDGVSFGDGGAVTISGNGANAPTFLDTTGGTSNLKLKIARSNGTFTGTLDTSDNGQLVRRPFSGVVLQSQAIGGGLYLAPTGTGPVEFNYSK